MRVLPWSLRKIEVVMTQTSVVLLIVVLSLVEVGRASYLLDTETEGRRETGADQQQLDALVEYLVNRIQREQEHPTFSGSLVMTLVLSKSALMPPFRRD